MGTQTNTGKTPTPVNAIGRDNYATWNTN